LRTSHGQETAATAIDQKLLDPILGVLSLQVGKRLVRQIAFVASDEALDICDQGQKGIALSIMIAEWVFNSDPFDLLDQTLNARRVKRQGVR
jgi:hypothetical protein